MRLDVIDSKANKTLHAAARHLRRAAKLLRRFAKEHPMKCDCEFCHTMAYEEAEDIRGAAWAASRHADAVTSSCLSPRSVRRMLQQYRQEVNGIIATDGSWAFLDVPPNLPLTPGEYVPDPPHFDGPEEYSGRVWDFTDTTAIYRGRSFHVADKPLHLLRALAARAGQPVPKGDLKEAVWDDRYYDDDQLRNLVRRLRRVLMVGLDLRDTPIVGANSSYKLTLV